MSRNAPTSVQRIGADIDALAAITEPGRPFTRRAFTPLFLQGRAYLEAQFRAAGLETRIDAAGNLIGRRAGARPGAGTIMLGSHSDTVPHGGRFDGIAGVVAALEVARALHDHDIVLDHDLEVTDFLAEEVSIFGVSCVGSRALAGVRPSEWLCRQSGEITLAEGIVQVGGNPEKDARRDDIRACLELHIEQGPVLETEGLDIGVVTAIAGITRIEIVLEGRADHAGTTPMGNRLDALVAASKLVLEVQRLACQLCVTDGHFAATVGEFEMTPNAANVVPSRVRMLIDTRAELRTDLDAFVAALTAVCAQTASETGVTITPPNVLSDNVATPMDAAVMDALQAACTAMAAGYRCMASGAGHDVAFMARISKVGMIFIPCVGGRSHTPEEWADDADIALGAAVLFHAVQQLDKNLKETSDETDID